MRSRVAWYIHHHGRGHLGRLLAIAPRLDCDVVCFSSLPRPDELPANCDWIELPRDDEVEPPSGPPRENDPTAGGLLHWAPILHHGHRRRLTGIAAAIDARPVSAFVVDVSVEIVLLARLLGLPPVLITQPGRRDDEPHRLAFRAAATVIAPWPRELLRPAHLEACERVSYVGGISRFDGRERAAAERSGVLVLSGAGGTSVSSASIDAAATATRGQGWERLGFADHDGTAWAEDPWDALGRAEVVVAWAGQNSIADLAVAGSRSIVIPQRRPFDEQDETAGALERAGLAVVARDWPAPERWQELLGRARSLQPDWSQWQTAGAADRAAAHIDAAANGRLG